MVSLYSTIKMMHGPINIRFTWLVSESQTGIKWRGSQPNCSSSVIPPSAFCFISFPAMVCGLTEHWAAGKKLTPSLGSTEPGYPVTRLVRANLGPIMAQYLPFKLSLHYYYYYYYYTIWMSLVTGLFFLVLLLNQRRSPPHYYYYYYYYYYYTHIPAVSLKRWVMIFNVTNSARESIVTWDYPVIRTILSYFIEQTPSWEASRFLVNQEVTLISWKSKVH